MIPAAGVLDDEITPLSIDQVVKNPCGVLAAFSFKVLRRYILGAVFDAEDYDPIRIRAIVDAAVSVREPT
jgi:hypothetical protein